MPPRPASRAGKKGKKKEKKKTPKQQIAELTEQNAELTEQLTKITAELDNKKTKLGTVILEILGGVKKKEYNIAETADIFEIDTDILTSMVSKLIVSKKIYDVSVTARVEELEKRLTEMSREMTKMAKKTLSYELGLREIIEADSLERAKDKAYTLEHIAEKQYFNIEYVDPRTPRIQWMDGFPDVPDAPTRKILDHAQKLNLVPPKKKMPGDTPIRTMHQDLKLFLIKELSMEKASGADWRMLASRVGIEQDVINEWKSHKLQVPMAEVFGHWEKDNDATVRMLHRHLMSPMLRCAIIAKRVSDFYDVD